MCLDCLLSKFDKIRQKSTWGYFIFKIKLKLNLNNVHDRDTH